MSILLTGSEIEALEIKHKPQNGPGSFMVYSRAIQLALIDKMRKEPVGKFDCENDSAPVIWYQVFEDKLGEPLYRLPTPQELENES